MLRKANVYLNPREFPGLEEYNAIAPGDIIEVEDSEHVQGLTAGGMLSEIEDDSDLDGDESDSV